MTDREMELLKHELLRTTELSRLNHTEADVVFARLRELGYSIVKTEPAKSK